MFAPRKLALLPLVALSLFAGCGDEEEGVSGAASAIPPDPVLYVEADISGEGAQHDNLDALLAELGELPVLGTSVDPRALIEGALEDLGEKNGIEISYAEDFEPWLGDTLAVGYRSLTDDPGFVFSVDVTDEEIARDSIERISAEDAAEETDEEYDGVSYQVSGSGDYAVGVFDEKFVLATADDFEAAVDASRGDSAATSDEITDTLGSLGDERLAALTMDLGATIDLAAQEGDADAAEAEAVREAYPELFEQPLAMALAAGERTLAFDVVVGHPEGLPEVGGTDRLGDAPGDAFAALGIGALGDQADALLDQIEPLIAGTEGAEGFNRATLDSMVEEQVGVPLGEVLSSLGDAVAFGRGDLGAERFVAGLDVEPSGDTAPLESLLDGLEQLADDDDETIVGPPLQGSDAGFSAKPTPRAAADSPVTFVNAELGETLSFAVASDRATAEQSGSGTLGDTELFQAAADALGDGQEMIAFVDLGQVLDAALGDAGLLDVVTGGASEEDAIASFLAEKLGFASIGLSYEDDRVIERIVLGLD